MQWTNELIIQFLELYEDEPIIWDPKNKKHKDRNEVRDAWERIQSKMNVNITLEEIKKKRDSLMATFRKLSAKVKSSMKTGSGSEDVFKPEWFAYEKMATFLYGTYTPRKTINSEELEEVSQVFEENIDDDAISPNVTDESLNLSSNEEDTFKIPPVKKRKNQKVGKVEKRLDEAYSILKSVTEKPELDECDLFTQLLGKKLKALNENYREIAMHQINNVMYRVKQSMLQSSSGYCPQPYPQTGYLPYQPPSRYPAVPLQYQQSNFPPPSNSQSQQVPITQPSPQTDCSYVESEVESDLVKIFTT